LNPTNTLKELKISSQKNLEILWSLEGISKLEISSTGNVDLLGPRNYVECELSCNSVINLHSSSFGFCAPNERLKPACYFPVDFTRFSEFQHYPAINLTNHRMNFSPPIPVLYGSDLTLAGFSLFHWNNMILESVKKLTLSRCTFLDKIPEMAQVTVLVLEFCNEFTVVPVLQSLNKLMVKSCNGIRLISFCPKLKYASFEYCPNLRDISLCSH
jgi:hypothetical protein